MIKCCILLLCQRSLTVVTEERKSTKLCRIVGTNRALKCCKNFWAPQNLEPKVANFVGSSAQFGGRKGIWSAP